jgi:hypothetical protein
MPDLALSEDLYAYDDRGERIPVSLAVQVDSGDLTASCLTESEFAVMISLASDLGRGEAAAVALALERGHFLATDDPAVRRHMSRLPQDVIGTSDLIRSWADTDAGSMAEVSQAIDLLQSRASFRPRASDPNSGWWASILGETQKS